MRDPGEDFAEAVADFDFDSAELALSMVLASKVEGRIVLFALLWAAGDERGALRAARLAGVQRQIEALDA